MIASMCIVILLMTLNMLNTCLELTFSLSLLNHKVPAKLLSSRQNLHPAHHTFLICAIAVGAGDDC